MIKYCKYISFCNFQLKNLTCFKPITLSNIYIYIYVCQSYESHTIKSYTIIIKILYKELHFVWLSNG